MAERKEVIAKGGVAELDALLMQGGMGGRGRRSTLSRWLRAHHDDFATMLAAKEPSWDEVAAGLSKMGLLDGGGRPPTGARVRKVWWETRRAKQAAQGTALMAGEIAPKVRVAPAAEQTEGDHSRPEAAFNIHPETLVAISEAGQLRTVTESSPDLSGVALGDSAPSSTRSIPDQGEDRVPHRTHRQTDATPSPLVSDTEPSWKQAVSTQDSDQVEVLRIEALPDPSPASAPSTTVLTSQPIAPATQNLTTPAPGKKQGPLGGLSFWRRTPQAGT